MKLRSISHKSQCNIKFTINFRDMNTNANIKWIVDYESKAKINILKYSKDKKREDINNISVHSSFLKSPLDSISKFHNIIYTMRAISND